MKSHCLPVKSHNLAPAAYLIQTENFTVQILFFFKQGMTLPKKGTLRIMRDEFRVLPLDDCEQQRWRDEAGGGGDPAAHAAHAHRP